MRWSLRLPAAIASSLVAAEAAVLLLRPREARASPLSVEARAYFSEVQLEKARGFRRGQRRILLASAALDGAALACLSVKPPAALERLSARPVLGGATAAAGLSAALTAAGLPLSALARRRGIAVGLVTRSWRGWAEDVAKSTAISAAFAAAGGAGLVAVRRAFGERWWLPGAGGAVAAGVLTAYAGPIVLDPLFNAFAPAEPALRAEIVALADRAGVRVDRVLVMDASKRTTASNAYVTGLGRTKRVVLYDNLLADFSPEEVRFVVAHELAHVRYDDVRRGLAYMALVAPAAALAAARVADALGSKPDARAVPATALALGLLTPAVGAVANQLSRACERRADAFALRLTGDPRTLIAFHCGIALRNVADPDPPRWLQLLLGTHPTTLERIGMAEAALCAS